MYLRDLRWPHRAVWFGVAAWGAVIAALLAIGIQPIALLSLTIVLLFFTLAPRRAKELGSDEMRDSRPDE